MSAVFWGERKKTQVSVLSRSAVCVCKHIPGLGGVFQDHVFPASDSSNDKPCPCAPEYSLRSHGPMRLFSLLLLELGLDMFGYFQVTKDIFL